MISARGLKLAAVAAVAVVAVVAVVFAMMKFVSQCERSRIGGKMKIQRAPKEPSALALVAVPALLAKSLRAKHFSSAASFAALVALTLVALIQTGCNYQVQKNRAEGPAINPLDKKAIPSTPTRKFLAVF